MAIITDTYVRNAKAEEKPREVRVDECIYLRLTLKKGKTMKKWLLRFTGPDGKAQRYTFGEYPEMGLADARREGAELLKRTKGGETMASIAMRGQVSTTFADTAAEWFDKMKEDWVEGHVKRQAQRLATINRYIGTRDVGAVTMEDVSMVVGLKTGAGVNDSARRTLSLIRAVLEYADSLDRLKDNRILIKMDSFRKTLPRKRKGRHFYVQLSDDEIGKLLKDIDDNCPRWRPETSAAMRLAPYVILRPNELCGAKWEEIDLDAAIWKIPPERMKMSREHIVPLPRQAVEILRTLHFYSGEGVYVFPAYSKSGDHLCSESLIRAFRRMGYASARQEGTVFTTHGFRGMASTILYQKLQYPGQLIELQLAHIEDNTVQAAYNRINSRSWLEQRRGMLQAYADYLDNLKEGKPPLTPNRRQAPYNPQRHDASDALDNGKSIVVPKEAGTYKPLGFDRD